MQKNYQKTDIDMCPPAVPERVSVALAELAGEGLLAPAVGAGLQVLAAMMEADVTAACGPKGRHDAERSATRHGHGARIGEPGRASEAGASTADAHHRRLRAAADPRPGGLHGLLGRAPDMGCRWSRCARSTRRTSNARMDDGATPAQSPRWCGSRPRWGIGRATAARASSSISAAEGMRSRVRNDPSLHDGYRLARRPDA